MSQRDREREYRKRERENIERKLWKTAGKIEREKNRERERKEKQKERWQEREIDLYRWMKKQDKKKIVCVSKRDRKWWKQTD